MPSLQLGTRANIVYFKNQSNPDGTPAAVFYRYDVQTASATMIAVEKQVIVLDAQLSRDGQWILFTAQLGHQTMFQLVRIDGKQLQTLYCAAPGTRIITQGLRGTTSPTQWSPDAKHLVFLQGASMASSQVLLLTLASGSLQTLLAGPVQYQPRTWMDNARIYVSSGPVAPTAMFILDTRNVAKGLQLVVGVGDTLWDFDSTYDATMLFITRYDDSLRAAPGIFCTIEAQPAAEPVGKLIFNSKTMLVVSVRVIGYGSSALLLSVANSTGDTSHNGLWKINVDGSGLTRLTSTTGSLNQFTQYPWSNFSRDSKLYTVSNSYGSLSGGKLTQFATSDAVLIGWTIV